MNVPPADLSPGDRIWSPGGEARVEEVDASGSLVRVGYRDRSGPAFVYLSRSRPVVRLEEVGRTP